MPGKKSGEVTRRNFLKNSSTGATAIAAMTYAPAVFAQKISPNELVGVGHVGCGVRGGQLVTDVAGMPDRGRPGAEGAEVRAICDIYKPHLEKGLSLSANSKAKAYHNYEEMFDDKDIDAVVIAVPDHLHSTQLIAAANAGKDVYIEKCWTRTIPEAKAMLQAVKETGIVMQLGHHQRASTAALQARDLIFKNTLGEITYVETGCYRNRARDRAEWRWYGGYNLYDRPDEGQVRNDLDWARFQGDSPPHPFSMERFWHWRCYWDYGTGIAGDLLSHAFDFANHVIRLGIPERITTAGNNNLLVDGREAPDTWNTIMEYPSRGLTLTYGTTFNSQNQGFNTDDLIIRGKEALMKATANGFAVYPEANSYKYKEGLDSGELSNEKPAIEFDPSKTPEQPSHMQDFINCVRSRNKTKCNEDEAFVEAVTCIMSVISYHQRQTVLWDAENLEVVGLADNFRAIG